MNNLPANPQRPLPNIIRIDDREASQHPQTVRELRLLLSRYHQQNPSEPEPKIELRRSEFGDYVFVAADILPDLLISPSIAIECATIADLCGKVNSGRLGFQLSNMIEQYDVRTLLIQGRLQRDDNGYVIIRGAPGARTSYDRVWDMLYAAECHGVMIEFVDSADQTAQRILQNYLYWQRPYDSHTTFRPQGLVSQAVTIPLGEALDSRIQFLMGLPGVGEDRARALLAEFGNLTTILAVCAAGGDGVTKVKGFGKILATKLADFVNDSVNWDNEIPN